MNNNTTTHFFRQLLPPGEGAWQRFLVALFALLLFGLCFLLFSCSEEDAAAALEREGTAVSFSLPEVASGTEPTRAGENLSSGLKVRVAVYKTATGGQSSANYVTTKDYTVQSDGSLAATDSKDLRLIEGTYDFYAITPDLAVTTTGNNPTVSVPQQTDFAVSLTTGQQVKRWTSSEGNGVKRAITLTELSRKCAKVTFAIDLAEDVAPTITDTKLVGASLTAMPDKLTASGTTLAAGSGTGTLTLDGSLFATNAQDSRKASGGTVVLPKTSGTFNLSMKARFNGVTGVTTSFPATAVPAMSFEGGKEYTFTVRLTKDKFGNTAAGLWITVSKWTASNQDYGMGGVPDGPVYTQQLGEWTDITWDAGMGGVPTGPIITGVSGWWNNIYYDPHLGSSDKDSND